ncbi:MAG: DedA family protein [Acidimicrobiales bacterium]
MLRVLGEAVGLWAYPVVFVATALEASALVGLVIPGETVLLLSGFLAFQGRLSLWLLMVLAATGAVLGDSVGYEIGRRFGPRLERTWAGRKVGSARWERALAQIRQRGPQAVLVGRFVGVLRAVVPATAGAAGMPYRSFLAWNVLGAVVWAPLMVGLGYLAGESYDAVARVIGWGSVGIVAALVAAGVTLWLVRRRRRADQVQEGRDRDRDRDRDRR